MHTGRSLDASSRERNNSHLGELPTIPSKAHLTPRRHIPRSASPSASSQASSEIYKELNNFSFVSTGTQPSCSRTSGDSITAVPAAVQTETGGIPNDDVLRRSSIYGIWEKAKKKQVKLERSKWAMLGFEYGVYMLLVLFIYFVLVGRPLWNGLTWYMWYVILSEQLTTPFTY